MALSHRMPLHHSQYKFMATLFCLGERHSQFSTLHSPFSILHCPLSTVNSPLKVPLRIVKTNILDHSSNPFQVIGQFAVLNFLTEKVA